eukprot:2262733-Amphidinium_carterae.1
MAPWRSKLHFPVEDLKRRTERSEGDVPRKIPHVEKTARLQVFTDRLPGVPVYGAYEPSDSLVDLCRQMAFEEAVGSRTQEVKDNILPKSFLKLAADGTLKEAHLADSLVALFAVVMLKLDHGYLAQ